MSDKIIRMKMTSVNTTTGNGMIRSRTGEAIPVRLSDKVLYYGIDEGDIATIHIIDGEYVVTDFKRPEPEPSKEDDYDVDELWGEY